MAWRPGQSNFAPDYPGNLSSPQNFNNTPRPFPGSMQQQSQPTPEPLFVQPASYDYPQANGYPEYPGSLDQQPYMDQQEYMDQQAYENQQGYYEQINQQSGMIRNPREDVEMDEDFPSYKELRSVFLKKQRESQDGTSRPAPAKVWKPKGAVSLSSEYQPTYKQRPPTAQKPQAPRPSYDTNSQSSPNAQYAHNPAFNSQTSPQYNKPPASFYNQSAYQAPQSGTTQNQQYWPPKQQPQQQYSPQQQQYSPQQQQYSPQQQQYSPQQQPYQSSSQQTYDKRQYVSQQSLDQQDSSMSGSFHQKPPAPRRQSSKTLRVVSRQSIPQSSTETHQHSSVQTVTTSSSGQRDIPIEVSYEPARRPTMLYPRPPRPDEDQIDFVRIGRPRRRNLSGQGMHVAISPTSPHSSALSSGQTSPKVVVTSNSPRSPQIARYRPEGEDYWRGNQSPTIIQKSPGIVVMNSPGHQPRRRTSYAEITLGSNSMSRNFRPRSSSVSVGMREPYEVDSFDYFSSAGRNTDDVFSRARNQGWSATIGSGQPQIRTGPQVSYAPSGPGPRAVHAQFNSPMGLYSTNNAQQALDQSIPQGTAAADTIKITGEKSEPKVNHTATLQMVLREDFVKKMTGHKPTVNFYKQAHEYGPGYGPLRQYVEHYME